MKIIIEGDDMTKEDLIEIGKFMVNFSKERKDTIGIFIEEGTEDLTCRECEKLLIKMFENNKCYTKIFEIEKEK